MRRVSLLPRFDAFDPAVREYPYPTYTRLRAAAPLCRFGPGAYGVTRHEDVTALQRDPRLGSEFPAQYHHMSVGDGPASAFFQRIVLYRDPPDHARLRKLFGKAVTPAVVRRLRGQIEQLVARLMAPALVAGRCDVVSTLAYPLPVMVISRLMNIPPAAHDDVRRHSIHLGRAFSAIVPEHQRRQADEAVCWLQDYVGRLLDERRGAPGDDLLSALLRAEDGGVTLTHQEIVDNAVFAFFAGFETTVHLITNGFALLLRNPGQFDRLRRDPSLAPRAVEEFLRFEAPIQGTARLVREPVTIGDHTVRAGRVLVLMLGSANHDETVFPHAERLDIGRDPNPHITFGGGAHLCLGAFLARTEAQVILEWLLHNTSTLHAAAAPQRASDTPFRAYTSLPVELVP